MNPEKPLDARIAHARDLANRPRHDSFLPFKSIKDLLQSRLNEIPQKASLIWYDREGERREFSRGEFFNQLMLRVEILRENGIRPGDRVATYSGNYPETVLSYFACWYYGCTVVPLSVSEDDPHLRFIIANAHVKIIFTRIELRNAIERVLKEGEIQLDVPLIIESSKYSLPSIENIGSGASDPPLVVPPTHDTEALIVYTSGTTGNPKGVVLDHYNLMVDALALAEHHQIDAASRMMCVLPIHHVNGTVVTLMTPMVAGATIVLCERFSVNNFFPLIEREAVNVVSVVPTLLAFLLEANASTEGLDLRLHHIICGAGPLTVDLAMRFEDRYAIPIAHGYGLSETTCYSCCLPVTGDPAEHRSWMSIYGYPSIGPALPVNEMAIHDSSGNPLDAGERGEIVIRGHNVMKEYYANAPANEAAFSYGWFRSGDEGFWLNGPNDVPYYFITGRLKELIIRGGVNIAPLEIDEVIMSVPGIRAGISVGFPHDLYGEEVGAYVILETGASLSARDIIDQCLKKLPFSKAPKVVLFGESLPVTSTGKYQRNKLRHLFEEWKSVRFK